MTIALQPLAQLDPDLVAQSLSELTARVQEDNPNLDLRRGVFGDLLAYYNALLGAQRMANVNDYLSARSLLDLTADPTLADPTYVDAVLSNFRLTREPGAPAAGEVTVVVSSPVTVTIAAGATWTAGGLSFASTQVYTAKVDDEQIDGPGDRLLVATPDGNYAFTITLEAADEGPAGNVKKDTLVVPDVSPNNYVTSYAAGDFTGGLAQETNQDLLSRLQQGLSCNAPSNRTNMSAMLRAISAFSRVVGMSIIGMGDPEMSRDRHWIFPVSGGGRVDWYVRSQEQVYRVGLSKDATLVSVDLTTGLGTWQFSVGRDEAPGFYEVASVRPPDSTAVSGGYPILSDVRGVDLTGTGFIPDVDPGSSEGVYTRFQTATVLFRDTDTDASALGLLSKKTYAVEVRSLPLIADIQDTVSGRDVRSCSSDVLVKAPVPCFLTLSLTVNKRASDPDPDLAGMKDALCAAVNNVGFVGKLYASTLQDAASPLLAAGQSVSAVDMFARIRYPSGRIAYRRGPEVLVVPDDPAEGVTARTAQFFATPDDVTISVASNVPAE